MKSINNYLLLITLCLLSLSMQAQGDIKSYSLKKGQAFDILLFNTNPEAKETLGRYFKSAIPVAVKNGYMPQKGFKVDQPPLQGNYWPRTVIIGLWEDFDKREQFALSITDEVPDFHEMRREIWTSFNLTYWEVQQDYSFEVNPEKFNVLTAYWSSDDTTFPKFRKEWLKQVEKFGGNKLIGFFKGSSPFGYEYNPDHLTITEWESKEAFDRFQQKNLEMNHEGVKHVNQFIIQ
ncbi:MAG: hypothetical protein ABJG78_11850 [Cyclobacteriaceae bacterium]